MVGISTGKAIQRGGPGHSLNRLTLKTQKLLSSSPSQRSALSQLGDNQRFVLRLLAWSLSGPLNWLDAILSLLHPLDRYRTASAIGSAIGRLLSRPISHPRTGGSSQPPRSKPLGGAQPSDSGAIVSKKPIKTSAKQKRDRGRDSQPRPRPRLSSQPQGATKAIDSQSPNIETAKA